MAGGGGGGIGSIHNAEGGREAKKFKNHCARRSRRLAGLPADDGIT